METPEKNFEASMKELEIIVKKLENGECALEESIALYEQGMRLSAECAKKLEAARQRIITLSQAEEESEIG